MYELLVKGGTVIDPAQGINDQRDIGISLGKITAVSRGIAPNEAKRVIDAKGKIVTPGLIDMHAHVADGLFWMAVAPDEAGVLSGVTTVGDGGSTGFTNFPGFRRYVISQARTDVFCFLHINSTGLVISPSAELWSWENINTEATLKTIDENRDLIKGIKIRAIGAVVENLGLDAIRVAKKVATEAGLPLMIHIGVRPQEVLPEDTIATFTREMLCLLEKGDILSHVYTWRQGSVIKPDGSILPELREAIQRGVVMDIAQGSHWSSEIAKIGLEKGVLPTTISTDCASKDASGPFPRLLETMSRHLAAGFTLEQLIEMTTINPARALGEEPRRGSLKTGLPADISVLELTEGNYLFSDGIEGKSFKGNLRLVPKLTLKDGVEIETHPTLK